MWENSKWNLIIYTKMGTLYKEQFRNENPVQDIHVWEPCT